jgi:hypothetical protein
LPWLDLRAFALATWPADGSGPAGPDMSDIAGHIPVHWPPHGGPSGPVEGGQMAQRYGRIAGIATAVVVGSLGVAGCQINMNGGSSSSTPSSAATSSAATSSAPSSSSTSGLSGISRNVAANRATISQFTAALRSGTPKVFEVTYAATGSAPGKVVYAVRPPDDLAFRETPGTASAGSGVDLVANGTGEFSCTPAAGTATGADVTCKKLGTIDAQVRNTLLDLYTPAHWATFLQDFSVAAGVVGEKVTTSNMTVNGFRLHCVDFTTKGVAGMSTICTTAQNLLGYVKLAGGTTSFAITGYSASPSLSLFALPRGASVTAAASQGG